MFERRIRDQGDLLARLGVAKATAQRLALTGGGERKKLVAVTVHAGRADVVEPDWIDRVDLQARRVVRHSRPSSIRWYTGFRKPAYTTTRSPRP
jgi:hypothetical protein